MGRVTVLAAALITALGAGCGAPEVQREELAAVVQRDIVRFPLDAPPEAVLARLSRSRVLVVGEVHENRVHFRMMAALVRGLHARGLRQLLLEFPHCWDWHLAAAAEEGVDAGWDRRYPMIGSGALVDAICRFNRDLAPEERIRVGAIDINHTGYGGFADIALSLDALVRRLPDPGPLAAFLTTYRGLDEVNRVHALEKMRDEIAADRSHLSQLWGEVWRLRVEELIEVELASAPIRALWPQAGVEPADAFIRQREDVVKRLCDRRIAEVAGATVIDVGANHAQKERLVGTVHEWLADYLVHRSAIAAGVTETLLAVPVPDTKQDNELLTLMAQDSGGQTAMLALDDPLFAQPTVPLSRQSKVKVCAPKRHYDAVILLPGVEPIR